MKIILFSRPGIEIARSEIDVIFSAIEDNGLDYMVNDAFAGMINASGARRIPAEKTYAEITPEMAGDSVMVSYGGDGTFLNAVGMLAGTSIPILGINFGRLGFLANVPKEAARDAIRELAEKKYTVRESAMLRVEGDFDAPPAHPYAFNEFTIARSDISMNVIHVFVNGEKLATYRGDGVLLATPSGSTAYALSVGGPIVAPECECFVLAPISPHNLTMRPLVIPDSSTVSFRVDSREPFSLVSLDNRTFRVKTGSTFTVTKAENKIFLIKLQNISFYQTLRNKMMWGMDGRDDTN